MSPPGNRFASLTKSGADSVGLRWLWFSGQTLTDLYQTTGNEKQFRGGLVFKARKLVVSLNFRPRVIKKRGEDTRTPPPTLTTTSADAVGLTD